MTIKNIFFISLVLISCKSNHDSTQSIHTTYELKGETIIEDINLHDPYKIQLMDSILIVANLKNDYIFDAFYIAPKTKKIKNFLQKGSGPDEINSIGQIQKDNNNNLYISDLFSHKLLQYDIKTIIDSTSSKPKHIKYTISDKNANITYTYNTPFGVIASNINNLGRICLLKEDTTLFIGKYPITEKIDKRLSESANAVKYQSIITVSPNGDKIASACSLADIVDTYTINEQRIDTLWSRWTSYPNDNVIVQNGGEYIVASTGKSIYHYVDINSTDKYIYLLYSGKTYADETLESGNIIRVISWDNKKSYNLTTEETLKGISVSKDNKYLYGICITDNGYEIKKYNLTDII